MSTLLPNPGSAASELQTAEYLRTLPAIRERCSRVHVLAQQGKLNHFAYHPEKEEDAAEFCEGLMKRDFSDFSEIPPHSRWRHLDHGRSRIGPLLELWSAAGVDKLESTRRLYDLFLVSVLLDAGAGSEWAYTETVDGKDARYTRSEGLGVASVRMFEDGLFSGDKDNKYQADAKGLASLSVPSLASAFQASSSNNMVGLEGRGSLLVNLSSALSSHPEFFGPSGRPGGLIDFLSSDLKDKDGTPTVHVSLLWGALIAGLAGIWPRGGGRTELGGVPLGDVWPCAVLGEGADALVPFHKLTGWTCYSLLEPLQKVLGWTIEGTEDMVGLPEYRNGGLLLDSGVLSLKTESIAAEFWPSGSPGQGLPRLPPSHPAIIEWRALTVIELDRIADLIRKRTGEPGLTLAQVLEAATWKGGRALAAEKRAGGGPPIDIISDGTVF